MDGDFYFPKLEVWEIILHGRVKSFFNKTERFLSFDKDLQESCFHPSSTAADSQQKHNQKYLRFRWIITHHISSVFYLLAWIYVTIKDVLRQKIIEEHVFC